ncbi:hypothetical protein ASG68_28780 [Rhizobium sp. Leaf453]|nr:hypothetical protein ASG50_25700 [Rhizobium sp. Leaf386]KQS95637.1 hypothetical protein ASG42_29435 [Rhizobium sp. Leaf391]KQU01864.1 hypothetical protein ASG68_28780 [Rhizobium sp. Leaf453]
MQLHVLPDEVGALVSDLLDDSSVFVTVVEGARIPLQFYVNEERLCPPQCSVLIFTLSPPVLSARSIYKFLGFNPDASVLQIGQLTSAGLSESWLSAMTGNKDAMKRWKQTAKLVRRATQKGAVAVNPKTGATAPMKGHRFSTGARALYLKGTAMLPWAGTNIIELIGKTVAE